MGGASQDQRTASKQVKSARPIMQHEINLRTKFVPLPAEWRERWVQTMRFIWSACAARALEQEKQQREKSRSSHFSMQNEARARALENSGEGD